MVLKEAKGKYAEDLIVILNTDKTLIESIRSGRAPRSVVEFEEYYDTMSKRNGAKVYAIVQDDRAIGLGMLAYRDYVGNSARLSFWIGTNYMNPKSVDEAFNLLMDEAIQMGLDAISGVMTDQDTWLIDVWSRYGGRRRDIIADGRVSMMLDIK